MRINDAQYLVGIDFGDGETTASVIEVKSSQLSGNETVASLNIKNASLPDRQKVESCIYRKKDNEWALAISKSHFSDPSLRLNFKNKPSSLEDKPDDKDALLNFFKIIFELLLANNSFLHYNPETGEKNFYLAAACPSRWAKDPWSSSLPNDTEVISYMKLMQEQIPVDTIIKESDAAFFHFLDLGQFPSSNATSLVIDYGSSTIDYTLFRIKDGVKETESDGSVGRDYGATKVEIAIQDYLEEQQSDTFNHTIDIFNETLEETNNVGKLKWEPVVRHYLKHKKEDYYSNFHLSDEGFDELSRCLYDISNALFKENSFFFNIQNGLSRDTIEEHILEDYKKRIGKEFDRIAAKCLERNPHWVPDFIMITGGASRMPWVKKSVLDSFAKINSRVDVKVDEITPSYVVSHGIVRYLRAFFNFSSAYDSLEKQISESYWLTDSGIRSKLLDAFKEAVGPVYSRELYSLLKSFENGDFTNDLRTLASKIKDFNANLSNYFSHDDIITCNKVATAFLRKAYSELVQEKVQEVFKDSFKLELAIPISINLSAILSNFYIDGNNYEDRVKSAYAPHTFTEMPGLVSLDTYRDSSDRHYIAEHYPRDLSGVTLSQNHWGSEVDMIRESVINAVHEARKKIPFTLY